MPFPKNLADDRVFFGVRTKKGYKPLPPARTFKEMAEEFGVTPGQLRWQMTHSTHPAPAPLLRNKSKYSASNTYYNRQEMRLWWSLHTAQT